MPKPMASTRVEVTRPDKLLWPEPGITKQAYVDYLAAVAEHMLPWLRDRPLSVIRAPDGVDGERYFQKNTPKYAPSWVRTVTIPAPSAGRDVAYTVCNDADTLAWLGNQAALELHPAPVRRDRLERPDLFVVDIDPPDDAFEAAAEVALLVIETMNDLGLEPLVKTTGGKGIHLVVPIVRRASAEQFRRAATRLANIVVERRPDLVTAEFRKAKRGGRVMLDPSRNGPGATLVAPFSPRARAEATVSFPVLPSELKRISPGDFTVATVRKRLSRPAVKRWSETANAGGRRLPAELLND
ncbi:MAG TPA: non-homologous end-joining DNA ligase [Actinomycetota bacterium]|nr:non-homologous end-joining DNA ligase [Actinomycetota bacterium]